MRRGAALTLVFAGVLATGSALGSWSDASDRGTGGDRPATGSTTRRQVEADVADAAAEAMADGKSPMAAARREVSRSGDRWGAVYSQGEYAEFAESLDGEYVGVGLRAKRDRRGRVEISRVEPGGPADRAQIRAGDRLTGVDGLPVAGLPVTEVLALLRGDATTRGPASGSETGRAAPAVGSRVVLGLERGGRDWRETLHRARLSTSSVTVGHLGKPAGGAILVKVSAFTKGTGERVRDAVRSAPAGAGVLLDLRGNSGGLVTEAAQVASVFLDGGLVGTYDVEGTQYALHAERGGDTRRPLVALVDGGTMSAAELLTGALQDRGRAVVVGGRTFGKASVQMPSVLPDGSVAELTVGHYRTPSGRSLDGRGVTPDLEAEHGIREQAETVLSGL